MLKKFQFLLPCLMNVFYLQSSTGMAQSNDPKVQVLHNDLEADSNAEAKPSSEAVIGFKPKFYYLKKLFMPWKWKKKKKSEKFKAISSVLERKMSTRISKDQLIEMGLIPSPAAAASDGDTDRDNNLCFDEAEQSRLESVSMFVRNLHDDSRAEDKAADRSWVSEVGVIPPPEMFSPGTSAASKLASRVSVMGGGEGLDLSDPNLGDKLEEISAGENERPVEATNTNLNLDHNQEMSKSDKPPKILSVVKLALEQQNNKLVLEVNNSHDDSENATSEPMNCDPDLGDEAAVGTKSVSSSKKDAPRPPLKEKPTNVNSPKTLEEWRERREKIGKSLERRLSARPSAEELRERNLIPKMSREEKEEIKRRISVKLERRLSIRPTEADLKNRNILRQDSCEESKQKQEETKNILQRKLSIRPSVAELKRRKILNFSEYIEVKAQCLFHNE